MAMKIKKLGFTSFLISTDNLDIVTDPLSSKDASGKFPKTESDVVLITDPKYGNRDDVLKGEKFDLVKSSRFDSIFELNSPGEFELSEVMIQRKMKSSYYILDHGYSRVVYVGLGAKDVSVKDFENLDDVEVLIVPAGDGELYMSWDKLQEIIAKVDPYVLVPYGFNDGKLSNEFESVKSKEEFLKHFGFANSREEKTLKVAGKVDSSEGASAMEVVILD